jgi:hypothetical protein
MQLFIILLVLFVTIFVSTYVLTCILTTIAKNHKLLGAAATDFKTTGFINVTISKSKYFKDGKIIYNDNDIFKKLVKHIKHEELGDRTFTEEVKKDFIKTCFQRDFLNNVWNELINYDTSELRVQIENKVNELNENIKTLNSENSIEKVLTESPIYKWYSAIPKDKTLFDKLILENPTFNPPCFEESIHCNKTNKGIDESYWSMCICSFLIFPYGYVNDNKFDKFDKFELVSYCEAVSHNLLNHLYKRYGAGKITATSENGSDCDILQQNTLQHSSEGKYNGTQEAYNIINSKIKIPTLKLNKPECRCVKNDNTTIKALVVNRYSIYIKELYVFLLAQLMLNKRGIPMCFAVVYRSDPNEDPKYMQE